MASDHIGEQFGSYRLEKLIGTGGFATVYLGVHTLLASKAAIKLLHAHLAGNEIQEFGEEARMIASLEHPHIVQVKDFAAQDGIPYLVLDYAPYGSLRSLHAQEGPFSLLQIASYIQQVADALFYAHQRKIIHRDIKPDNMLLNARREVLLGDFGIAVLVQSTRAETEQSVQGTFAYTSPEQIQGHPRPASDQYSLAVVAYEWICGRRPFSGTVTELMGQHVHAQPPRPSLFKPGISPQIEQVLLRSLEKDPQRRFPTVIDFASALTSACQDGQFAFDDQAKNAKAFSTPVSGAEATILPAPIPPTVQAAPFAQAPQTLRATPTTAARTPPVLPTTAAQKNASRQRISTSKPRLKIKLPRLPSLPRIRQPELPSFRRSTHKPRTTTRRKALVGILGGLGMLGLGGGTLWFKVINPFLSSIPYTYTGHQTMVSALAWSPDGQRIASGDKSASIHVWDAFDGNHVQHSQWSDFSKAKIPSTNPIETRSLSWGGTNQSLAIGFSTMPFIMDLTGYSEDPSIDAVAILNVTNWKSLGGLRKGGYTVAWSPDGTKLASASYYWHTIDVWNAATGQEICRYSKHGQDTGMDQIAWSPDGTHIASAGGDGTVQIWNARTAEHIITLNSMSHATVGTRVRAVAWSPDGSRIVSAGDDENVSVWNVASGKKLFMGSNPGASMSSVSWSPNGKWIASGSDDNTIQVWDARNGKLLTKLARNGLLDYGHTENVNAVAWSPDSTHLATASDDDTVIVWKPSW